MTAQDLAQVIELESQLYEFPWANQIFISAIDKGYNCWVYERKSIQGYLVINRVMGEAQLLNIAVAHEVWGQGLGRKLLTHAINWLIEQGDDTLFLEVRQSNKQAIALYESIGFVETGIRKNYYQAKSGREDAIMMALVLSAC